MADTYLFFVIVLFALAIFDLIVGVSNDAVNFLNSSIGSKVAKRHVIMLVASVGIFIGAAFSSGMMEVARKSIFYPGEFAFEEIMVIFMAVMLTDIILLDLFNTFGLPTSTTVSIVFELLGAAVAVSLIKMTNAGEGLSEISTYINFGKAGEIAVGILLSVLVAFTVGSIVMYLSRLLFSFQIEKKLKNTAPVWGGLAMAAMSYFLFAKGLKNVDAISNFPFVSVGADELAALCGELKDGIYPNCIFDSESSQYQMYFSVWLESNVPLVGAILFVFWAIALKIGQMITKGNVLRFVVLFGTFSLAMAFAGNDLVNFIGVPIAGYESYGAWVNGGMDTGMSMEALGKKVPTNPWLLVAAGAIMVGTLWGSRKARAVSETELKLGRQDEGSERFQPNTFSRGIVQASRSINKVLAGLLPSALSNRINRAFAPPPTREDKEGEESKAFDLLRASVNLSVASMIITYASSRKLPLSTTYVTFMVSMGASLADRAWGRDSAVFRIAGVLNVILGWFGTAFIAFTVSAIFASAISFGGVYAVIALILLAVGLVVRSGFVHRRRESQKKLITQAEVTRKAMKPEEVRSLTLDNVADTILAVRKLLSGSVDTLIGEKLSETKKLRTTVAELKERNSVLRYSLFHTIKRIQEQNTRTGRLYLKVYDLQHDFLQSAETISRVCAEHVANFHAPLDSGQAKHLKMIKQEVNSYLEHISTVLTEESPLTEDSFNRVITAKTSILHSLENFLDAQTKGIREEDYNSRNSMLNFSLTFELRALVAIAARFVKLYYREGQTQGVNQEIGQA